MRLRIALITTVAALVGASAALSSPSAVPKLKGTVGPGFTITLKKPGVAKKVTALKAGTYSITVVDKSSIHNFVLEKAKGGKFEKEITGVGFVGTKTVTVKLTKGKYEYYCTPHESSMFGFFVVT